MEYCPCGDAGYLLKKEKRFGEDVAKIYIAEIITALTYLHGLGIIYRDLKPDNIIIDEQGHAKLTDFGLSKEGITEEYNSMSFCGSHAYLAPEMLNQKPHGKSVDWYGVGVLLYEFLAGVPPYFDPNRE